MLISELPIPGAHVIEPRIHRDDRGDFLEWFRADLAAEAFGRRIDVAQANTSVSARGVLRGIHYAQVPLGQAKYVTVARGSIVDFVVDLRVGSPTFGSWEAVELDATNRRAVFLAEGLGHAFLSLEDETTVSYLVTDVFCPEREHAITPLDTELALDLRLPHEALIVSEKDRSASSLADAVAGGMLPTWEQCQDRYREVAVEEVAR